MTHLNPPSSRRRPGSRFDGELRAALGQELPFQGALVAPRHVLSLQSYFLSVQTDTKATGALLKGAFTALKDIADMLAHLRAFETT